MDLFVIDTTGDTAEASTSTSFAAFTKLPETYISAYDGADEPTIEEPKRAATSTHESDDDEDDDEDYAGLPPPSQSISEILNQATRKIPAATSQVASYSAATSQKPSMSEITKKIRKQLAGPMENLAQTNVEQEMSQAVLTPGIEKKEDIARLAMSDEAIRKLRRLERQKTKGKKWFHMSAPEVTPELQNELALLKMRSVLDPKQSFKRIEKRKQLPKYFEMGKVIDSPLDHFNERGVKKLKSKSLVDELLADAEFQKFNKRKYAESLERQKKKAYHKAVEKMKREKKRSKRK
uniref:Fcf2 domain-containing protein n=1 Tax=Anopheles dirus TaxID=7168 RepID=A0A182NUM7_9DIPT